MTEKRFENVGKDILQYDEWWCSAGGEHCADVIATALNEICDENEQLKSENNMLKVTIGRNEAYIKRLTETSEWHC